MTAVFLSACAHKPEAVSGSPDISIAPGVPAPAHGKLYADCLGAAISAATYEKDPKGDWLRFRCGGAPAKALYDGFEAWSTKVGSQYVENGRTWRFSQKLVKNAEGIDHCSVGAAGDYACLIVLNVGEFLAG